jgi:hypothetical protein
MAKKRSSKRAVKKVEKVSKYEKQAKWIIISMIVLIAAVVIVYYFVQSSKSFEYGGINFQKIMYDKLPLFYSKIPVTDINGNLIYNYNIYLRNDPRKNDVVLNGTIRLMKNAVFSIDPSIEGCSDNGVAGVSIGTFFRAAGINVSYASSNESDAKKKEIEFVTCKDSEDKTVIILKQGDKNIISQEGNCYTIEFTNCEVIKSVEKFIVGAIANSKGKSI